MSDVGLKVRCEYIDIVTNPELTNMYQMLNHQLFEGSLPEVPCLWNGRLRRTLGRTFVHRNSRRSKWRVTKIDIQSGLSDEVLHKTMVHEMCHVWCCIHHQQMGHTRVFWEKMAECGYPDGHSVPGTCHQDRWQLTTDSFGVGDNISFPHPKLGEVFGHILRVNRRTLTIMSTDGTNRWRVSPSLVTKI